MKRHCYAVLTAIVVTSLAPCLRAQTATDLIKQHTTAATAALEAYLKAHPEATDTVEAIDFLIEASERLADEDRLSKYLRKKYELLPKGPRLDPQEFFEVYQALFGMQLRSGDRAGARAAMARAKTDIEGHAQSARLTAFIDQIGAELNKPSVGESMELKFTSMGGDEIDLSTMSGKVVLVDFWATWCKPCVAEMPNVIETYQKLHGQGFEVIGISLDNDKTAKKLKNYIAEKEIPWPQAFDGAGWQNELAKKFGINSIPATFLIGKDGKVVATNLRGPALGQAVRRELAK